MVLPEWRTQPLQMRKDGLRRAGRHIKAGACYTYDARYIVRKYVLLV